MDSSRMKGFGELLAHMREIPELEKFVIERIARLRKRDGKTDDEALDAAGKGLRAKFRRALRNDRIINPYDLAEVLGGLGFRTDDFFPMRYPLLSQWPERSRVEVFIGGHIATKIRDVEQDVRLQAVGLGDALAFADLIRFFQHEVEVNVRFGLRAIPPELPYEEAVRQIDRALENSPGLGAVVSIGSEAVNTVTAALTDRILGDEEIPFKFRWTEPTTRRLGRKRVRRGLSDCRPVKPEQEGLWWSHMRTAVVRRADFPRERDSTPGGDLRGQMRDCGVLLLDVRELPWRIVLAGHGSDGTQAAVLALREQGLIHTRLADPSNESLGLSRAYLIVETLRRGGQVQYRPFDEDDRSERDKTGWKNIA
jgi:hypothetical protein